MAIMSEDDVLTRLGISKADLDQLVDGGRLTPTEEDGELGFSALANRATPTWIWTIRRKKVRLGTTTCSILPRSLIPN